VNGVTLHPLKQIENPKGSIYHAIKRSSPGFSGFGEAYFSTVAYNETKGWKRHRKMTLNLVVPVGEIEFVVRQDDAPDSEYFAVRLSQSNYQRLTVEPGLWMAFRGLGSQSNMLLNIASIEHDPDEADNRDLDSMTYPESPSAP
jgi:dTDP-4-dehydrorhamnose 3,5-epimerase